MRNFYVTLTLLILIILFASLQSFWGGLVYFALSFLIILCLYWIMIFINQYIVDYYSTFEEDFKKYCAEIINSTSITSQELNENINFYKKKYKRSLIRDKVFDIAKILFAFSVIAYCIAGMTMV